MDIEKIVREYILKTIHMSLASATKDGKPWVCEVHFAFDDDLNLYFVSKPSTRHCQEISTNPYVAGNIIKQHSLEDSPHGVYFEGTAILINAPTQEEIALFCEALNRDRAELARNLQEAKSHNMYKIEVTNWAIFGKFGQEKNSKYELVWGNQNA